MIFLLEVQILPLWLWQYYNALCALNTVLIIFKYKNVNIEMISLGEALRIAITRNIFHKQIHRYQLLNYGFGFCVAITLGKKVNAGKGTVPRRAAVLSLPSAVTL